MADRHAALIDRDGTLSLTGGYCHPDAFELAPFAPAAIRRLNDHGVACAVVTNQTGVAHGSFSARELRACFRRMIQELKRAGARLDAIYYCPHRAECAGHKPQPGMLTRAAHDFGVPVENCFMIGDTGSDMTAGSAAGCRTILVRTGWGLSSLTEYRDEWRDVEPDRIAENLLDAARHITAALPRYSSRQPAARTLVVEL